MGESVGVITGANQSLCATSGTHGRSQASAASSTEIAPTRSSSCAISPCLQSLCTQRRVPREDIEFLLEAGRLSPSSFGLEPWRLVVVKEPSSRWRCKKRAWISLKSVPPRSNCHPWARSGSRSGQRIRCQDVAPGSTSVAELPSLLDAYREFARHNDLTAWSIAQCHIAAANIMTAAPVIGVDTCAIGAFSATAILVALGTTSRADVVALLVALGYRRHAPTAKQRFVDR